MDANDRSKEGQIQLLIEYGSQHGQLQVYILEVNSLVLPAVKQLGITHIYVKSYLLSEKTKDTLKTKNLFKGFVLPDGSKELKRKTEEVKLTLCHERAVCFEETGKSNEKSRKNKLRKALQKQRERFRLRRNSDKVKTVVNAAGEDDGRATLSFERPLYYPSVSLYQLQTQFLYLTICGRNIATKKSFPIATANIPLMLAIKQHHPTWYQLSYNPDLVTIECEEVQTNFVQDGWEKHEGGTNTGRSLAWDMKETKEPSNDNWLHKRKDYSRHLQQKGRRPNPAIVSKKKNSLPNDKLVHDRLWKKNEQYHKDIAGYAKKPKNYQGNCIAESDSGVDLEKMGTKQDSIEELHFDNKSPHLDTRKLNEHSNYTGNFQKPHKQWTSEFLICAPSLDTKRTSIANDLDLTSLSLHGSFNRTTFGDTIRGF